MELQYTLSVEQLRGALLDINKKNLNRASYNSSFALLYGVLIALALLRIAAQIFDILPEQIQTAQVYYGMLILAAVVFICLCKWVIGRLSRLTVRGVVRMQSRKKGKWGKRLTGEHTVTFSETSVTLDNGKPFLWTKAYYVLHKGELLFITGRHGQLLVCSLAGLSDKEKQKYYDYLNQYVYLLSWKDIPEGGTKNAR